MGWYRRLVARAEDRWRTVDVETRTHILLPAPTSDVWAFVSSAEHLVELGETTHVVSASYWPELRLGADLQLSVVAPGGARVQHVMRVAGLQHGTWLELESASGGAPQWSRTEVAPAPGGCQLTSCSRLRVPARASEQARRAVQDIEDAYVAAVAERFTRRG